MVSRGSNSKYREDSQIVEVCADEVLALCPWPAFLCRADGSLVSANEPAAAMLEVDVTEVGSKRLSEALRDQGLAAFIWETLRKGARTGLAPHRRRSMGLPDELGYGAATLELGGMGRDQAGDPLALIIVRLPSADEDFLQRRSRVMSKLAHTIRSSLTTIQGFSELLLGRSFDAEQTKRYLGFIHKQASKLGSLMSDLESVVHHEGGRDLKLVVQPIPVGEVVREACSEASRRWPEAVFNNKLASKIAEMRCHADGERVVEALVKVLDNAVAFSPKGSPIELDAARRESICEIAVTDQGSGIEPRESGKVFEPFYMDRADDESDGHLGTGLTVARHICESHGGYLVLESEPGEGTTVKLGLPLAE
jgi:signal transduction histidine kinase